MSHIQWPENVDFKVVVIADPDPRCQHCGASSYVRHNRHRYANSTQGPVHLVVKTTHCPNSDCPGFRGSIAPEQECRIGPPSWTMTFDLFAWIGHRRFAWHFSVPQIQKEANDRFGLKLSADVVEDYLRRYQAMVAMRQSDVARLVEAYKDAEDLVLSIDGLQPDKGHETLYVVREIRSKRIWFAQPLLSSSEEEVQRVFERARQLAESIAKPVRGWVSDKQAAFVKGVANVFPGVPHRYCANHFLRDLAKPMLEADSHAKVQMRRKVRGLREIERRILAQRPEVPDGQSTPAGQAEPNSAQLPACDSTVAVSAESHNGQQQPQVVLDYCAAVRGILNDDQGGPIHPPGVRMAEALGQVQASIGRSLAAKKGGLAIRR